MVDNSIWWDGSTMQVPDSEFELRESDLRLRILVSCRTRNNAWYTHASWKLIKEYPVAA